jgi:hypothetical protein
MCLDPMHIHDGLFFMSFEIAKSHLKATHTVHGTTMYTPAICSATVKATGKPCTCKALKGTAFCGKHTAKNPELQKKKEESTTTVEIDKRDTLQDDPLYLHAPTAPKRAVSKAPLDIEAFANQVEDGKLCARLFDQLHNMLVLNKEQHVTMST